MAKQIKAHPDGKVYILNGALRYLDSSSNFSGDMQEVGKKNPVAERNGFWEYNMVDGPNFSTIDENGMHGEAEVRRWMNAEAAINAIEALLAVQAARQAAQSQPQM